MCEYCEKGKRIEEVENDNIYFAIFGRFLRVHGRVLSIPLGRTVPINYCPMCRKEAGRVKHITLKEMLEEIVYSIVQKEEIKDYYYKNNAGDYKKITSVDLLYRIKFGYDDFTEYEWELEESRLYKEESYDK